MAISKSHIKLIRSLHNLKGRRKSGLFLVEGPELIKEALQEGWLLKEVLITHSVAENHKVGAELRKLLKLADVPCDFCSQSELERIADTKTPQGVVALAQLPTPDAISEKSCSDEILLICECVSDPGNLGTILRTADWFGLKTIALGPGSADLYNPKVVRSSAGSVFRITAKDAEDLSALIKREIEGNRQLYAAAMDGDMLPVNLPRKGKRGLLLGHEKRGISAKLIKLCTSSVCIPSHGRAESLNMAVAAGILLYSLVNN